MRPRVSYTVIESANDEVVTPYTSAFLSGPGVTNILLQSQYLRRGRLAPVHATCDALSPPQRDWDRLAGRDGTGNGEHS
jgi:hypothetical protein